MLTQEKVKELFEYRDGGLYWKIRPAHNVQIGSRAGYDALVGKPKYLRRIISIENKNYYEYRLIFMYHHGYFPPTVDHRDGNSLNNKIENLRAATKTQNNQNSKKRCDNTSGHKGVCWDKNRSKWLVRVKTPFKRVHLGYYEDFELACLVADEARDKYHGMFSSTRRVTS